MYAAVILLLTGNLYGQIADQTKGCAPLTVNFSTSNAVNYWDFGNSTSASNDVSPSAVYTRAGNYVAILYDRAGGTEIGRIDITVYDLPDLGLTVDLSSGCAPLDVNFTPDIQLANELKINSLQWVFGDGRTTSGNSTQAHTYQSGGNYNVSLQLETDIATCNVQQVFTSVVEVFDAPAVDFSISPDPPSSCTAPFTISLENNTTDVSSLTYSWDFGNGQTSNSANPPDVTYTSEGTFDIVLTATNAKNCSASITKTVNVGSPVGIINVPDTLCLDVGVVFEYFGANRVTWGFDTDAQYYDNDERRYETITSSREKSIEIFYRTPGLKTIMLETNNGGCVNTVSKQVFVQQLQINPVTLPESSCENPVDVIHSVTTDASAPTFNWSFYDGSTSTDQSATVSYLDDGNVYGTTGLFNEYVDTTHVVPVIVTSGTTGCYDTAWTTFRHYPLNAKVLLKTADASGCAPDLTIEFSNGTLENTEDPFTLATWNFGDPSASPLTLTGTDVLNDVSHTYSYPGNYEVTLYIENQSGCSSTSYPVEVSVGLDASALIDFSANRTTACPGEAIEFTPDFSGLPAGTTVSAWHFYTEGKRSFNEVNASPATWIYSFESGLQDVTLEVEINGCLSSITKNDYIDITGAVAEIAYDRSCEKPYEINFESNSTSGSGTLDILWDFGDGMISSDTKVTHTYGSEGLYTVTLTASDGGGCAATIDQTEILIVEPKAVLTVDPLVCAGKELKMDASGSHGVGCRGYTYRFPTFDQRPITWDKDTFSVTLPEADLANIGSGIAEKHELQLIITDELGCKDTTSVEVQPFAIQAKGSANLTRACLPQEIVLTDSTLSDAPIASWTWGFSNGDTIRSTTSGDATFLLGAAPPNDRKFYATLEVEDINGCKSGIGDTLITIDWYRLRSRISVSEDEICVPALVEFTANDDSRNGSNLSFDWDFGNGIVGDSIFETVRFENEGDFEAKLIFTEQSSGCYDSLFTSISAQAAPIAAFETDVDSLTVYCNPQTITFNDTSFANAGITSLQWDFDNGESSDQSVYTTTYTKGTYDVSLTAATSNGCENTTKRTFEIVGPEGDIRVSDQVLCKGQTVTFELADTVDITSFEWFFGDGTSAMDVSPIDHTYDFVPVSGNTLAQLILRSNECTRTVETPIDFHIVEAGFSINDGIDTVICTQENSPFIFIDESVNAEIHSWDFDDGFTSDLQNPTHQYGDAGIFTVTQIIENATWGCRDTISRQVVSAEAPDTRITASADSICLGETVELLVQNIRISSNYSWTPESNFADPSATNVSFEPENSLIVSLTEADSNSCVTTVEKEITVVQPFEFADWETTIKLGESVALPIELDPFYDFELSPNIGLSCENCSFPEVSPEEDITYELTITDRFSCFSDRYNLTVIVIPPAFISMPDNFSPNGDGANDVAYMGGRFIDRLIEYKIFNRWGELLFHTDDPDLGWDGTFNGRAQNAGVYVYKIRAVSDDGETIFKEGYINLIK